MLLHPEQTLNSSGQQIGLMTGTFSTFCSYSQALDSYQQHEVRFNFETPRKAAKFLLRHLQQPNTAITEFDFSRFAQVMLYLNHTSMERDGPLRKI